jgi:hypothetical protein
MPLRYSRRENYRSYPEEQFGCGNSEGSPMKVKCPSPRLRRVPLHTHEKL